jgi:CMP-N-acetylneuraminate monooxygenase
MAVNFETLGNATIQLFDNDGPALATDPWLVGTCYFGSWALDHALSPEQIANVLDSKYIWISHGHPDHLHHESLDLLPQGKKFLLPDHYDPEIRRFLTERGFEVTILPYRKWFRISPRIEVLCLDNINQDAILVVRLGDATTGHTSRRSARSTPT